MKQRRTTLYLVAALLLACVVGAAYLVVRFQMIRMSSASMELTIHNGAFLLVDRFAYVAEPPRRGDVVAIGVPNPFLPLLVERVVAVPGDRFVVHNGRALANGRLAGGGQRENARYELLISDYDIVVNGKRFGELRLLNLSDWTSPDTVPRGCYVVLGDNRNNALDSHLWGFFCPNRASFLSPDPVRLIGRVLLR
jgi:signal peptidase I